MKLKYMPPTLNPLAITSHQVFIFPDGCRTLTPKKMTTDGKHNIEERIYKIDLYTSNSMIDHNEFTKNVVSQLTQKELLDLVVKNNMDFYAFWLSGIDKLIRYFGLTVQEAIQSQLATPRTDLYEMINTKEHELFPVKLDNRSKNSP
jgi:hypothetical protein